MAKIDCVPLSDIFDEFKEAIEKRREEIKEVLGYYLDPDYETYRLVADSGRALVVTLRDEEGKIVGWSLYYISASLRRKAEFEAENHTIFVDKEYREAYGERMITDADKFLKRLGVKRSRFMNDIRGFGRMLASLGYNGKTVIWEVEYE